jgi:hypothetical protein
VVGDVEFEYRFETEYAILEQITQVCVAEEEQVTTEVVIIDKVRTVDDVMQK